MYNPTEHFYNEIYSYYFNTVARLINLAIDGELTTGKEEEILYENENFSEDLIVERLHLLNEWFLMEPSNTDREIRYETAIQHKYKRPVSLLEKRWLKSIVSDPRIRLFNIDFERYLEDVEPLFDTSDFLLVGCNNDGDDYTDDTYIHNFRTVLKAMREGWALSIVSENAAGEVSPEPFLAVPRHMEYSEKEDKFILYTFSPDHTYKNSKLRMSRIHSAELRHMPPARFVCADEKGEILLMLQGDKAREQNVVERILIDFSHHEKRVRETDEGDYLIRIRYLLNEEKEIMVHQLVPYAHYIKILSPDNIRRDMAERINRQYELLKGQIDL